MSEYTRPAEAPCGPMAACDIRLGQKWQAIDIDTTAITSLLEREGLTPQQIHETCIYLSDDAPKEDIEGAYGYIDGIPTVTLYIGHMQPDEDVPDTPLTMDASQSQHASGILKHELRHRMIDVHGMSLEQTHYGPRAVLARVLGCVAIGSALAGLDIAGSHELTQFFPHTAPYLDSIAGLIARRGSEFTATLFAYQRYRRWLDERSEDAAEERDCETYAQTVPDIPISVRQHIPPLEAYRRRAEIRGNAI